MRVELVVTDLDGTLWELEDVVHDRTSAAASDGGRADILHLLDLTLPG